MAVDRFEQQITWSSNPTVTLSSTAWFVSDEITLNDADWEGMIALRADNSGTPASGDTCEVRVLYTAGDVDDGGGSADYPTMNTSGTTGARANLLALLDTYSNYDPDMTVVPIETAGNSFKLAARAAQGGTRSIVLAARLVTHRGAIA